MTEMEHFAILIVVAIKPMCHIIKNKELYIPPKKICAFNVLNSKYVLQFIVSYQCQFPGFNNVLWFYGNAAIGRSWVKDTQEHFILFCNFLWV